MGGPAHMDLTSDSLPAGKHDGPPVIDLTALQGFFDDDGSIDGPVLCLEGGQ